MQVQDKVFLVTGAASGLGAATAEHLIAAGAKVVLADMNSEMELMLKGYGLTTAQILYRLPDHPSLLQTNIWQHYDLAPDFPEMRGFLRFWQDKIEGPLHSVRFTHRKLISPGEWRNVVGEFRLH